jgi:hypothetical protein
MLALPIRQDAIMASKAAWAAFPHDAKAYTYPGDALKKAWPKLHAGDCEPFPDDKRAAALLKAAGKAAPGLDAPALAIALQQAWRDFHRGDFKSAFDGGSALGAVGASVAATIGINAKTAYAHRTNIYAKLRLGSDHELRLLAMRRGLIGRA